jgi:fatty acid desaturase
MQEPILTPQGKLIVFVVLPLAAGFVWVMVNGLGWVLTAIPTIMALALVALVCWSVFTYVRLRRTYDAPARRRTHQRRPTKVNGPNIRRKAKG